MGKSWLYSIIMMSHSRSNVTPKSTRKASTLTRPTKFNYYFLYVLIQFKLLCFRKIVYVATIVIYIEFITHRSIVQTCIICENSTVEEKAELKECIIGAKQTVEPGGELYCLLRPLPHLIIWHSRKYVLVLKLHYFQCCKYLI